MDRDKVLNECMDLRQSFTIELPCAMAERIVKLAREKDMPLSNLMIEALDKFLREQG
ncbi:MAG: hypothetical protein ABIJ31_12180 [Pseudomonadota bacterium]